MDTKHIRNFAIIAHIDHGKSTLSDRLLELTGSLTAREMQAQVLDAMDLERERGITIKAHAVRMNYLAQDGEMYQLNLLDTPGHVDFSYEVSRSLACCEGALLVVDASQGVEAQTLANAHLAINNGLDMIPVINKIDLPSADVLRTQEMIESTVGLDATDALPVSAKTGLGVPDVLEAIVRRLPPPTGDAEAPLQALIFDCHFDPYRGVIVLCRVMSGILRKGMKIRLMSNDRVFDVEAVGVLTPKPLEIEQLSAGEVGFFSATIKNVADTKIGDTVTEDTRPAAAPLPGFKDIQSMVFAGLYTVDSHEHTLLLDAYSNQNKFTLVLDTSAQQTPVLWANGSTDITKAVVDAYNAKSGVPPQPAAGASTPSAPRPSTSTPGRTGTTPRPSTTKPPQ